MNVSGANVKNKKGTVFTRAEVVTASGIDNSRGDKKLVAKDEINTNLPKEQAMEVVKVLNQCKEMVAG